MGADSAGLLVTWSVEYMAQPGTMQPGELQASKQASTAPTETTDGAFVVLACVQRQRQAMR